MTILELLNGVKTGTLDARAEVLSMLRNMTPVQKRAVKQILPQVEEAAKKNGVSTEGFLEELSAQLT